MRLLSAPTSSSAAASGKSTLPSRARLAAAEPMGRRGTTSLAPTPAPPSPLPRWLHERMRACTCPFPGGVPQRLTGDGERSSEQLTGDSVNGETFCPSPGGVEVEAAPRSSEHPVEPRQPGLPDDRCRGFVGVTTGELASPSLSPVRGEQNAAKSGDPPTLPPPPPPWGEQTASAAGDLGGVGGGALGWVAPGGAAEAEVASGSSTALLKIVGGTYTLRKSASKQATERQDCPRSANSSSQKLLSKSLSTPCGRLLARRAQMLNACFTTRDAARHTSIDALLGALPMARGTDADGGG
mmetsp:Transcript_175396/g.562686  ORF Transcript_175396/g.562686 Transcript_175396/m.562686 type:complete len:297 (-) Transcript_175396:53-943(-)